MKYLALTMLLVLAVACNDRSSSGNPSGKVESLRIVSLSYFAPWGYGRELYFLDNGISVEITIRSERVTQRISVTDNDELSDVLGIIKDDIEFGFKAGESEIGHRVIDAGGHVFKWKGRKVCLYDTKDTDLGFYEEKLISDYKRLAAAMAEYDATNGM